MTSPRAIAVIPARGGSKGVPGKNVTHVGGRPLVARAVEAARTTPSIDRVFVSTDDVNIAEVARASGAEVIDRPAELADDIASSEAALLHAAEAIEHRLGTAPAVMAFLQATSPFMDVSALDTAVARVAGDEADTVFSAVETYEFLWRLDRGTASALNHDASHRPRRQDREPHYRETGAFYVMSWPGFRRHRHRFFGRVAVQPVSELSAIDIDTVADIALARTVAPLIDSAPSLSPPINVQHLVTDFDGVHTNDTAIVAQDGTESVTVSRSDGYGVQLLRNAGVPLLILSKERNPVVTARAHKLGASVVQAADDKMSALLEWATATNVNLQDVAYIGNDLNDLEVMGLVGWPVAVADAHPSVRQAARVLLTRPGGRGAIREFADMILNTDK